ncbi:hypothetical protein LCGC14_0778860 [marine sediment metagenome]|uniref:Bacteriophage tail tape measure C-terminal domain-containing protein n=1 Tax=marine sediment metagenome TaxID=412755 RepID=A0A0F9PWB2_9ZZZZ
MVQKKVGITLKGKDLASRTFGKVRSGINRIKSAVFSLQGAFVALGAIIVGKFAKTFIDAFVKQQDAVESLKASLIATGKEGEASLRRLTTHAAELQKVTRAGDEATIQATASLALLAPALDVAALERAQSAIIGIADVFFKGDLESAALQIGKTVGGATNSLSRYGLQIDMSGDANARMNEILEQSNRFFEVSKARAQTLGGRLARLGNSWGDLKERIGQFLGESPRVNQFFEDVRMTIEDFTSALDGTGPQIAEAFAALGAIGGNAFAVAFLRAVQFLEDDLGKIFDGLGGMILDKLKGMDPLLKALIETRAEGRARGEAQQEALRTGLGRLFRPGTSERLGAPPAPVAGPPAEALSLIDRLVEERIRALFAGRERLAAVGAGFKPPSGPAPIPAPIPAPTFATPKQLQFGLHPSPFLGNRQPPGSQFFRNELTETVRRQGAEEAKRLAEEAGKAAQGLDILGQSVVTNFSQMAAAALSGSQQMEQVVISAFTNILSSLPGVGGFGALIGAVGGIFGSLFGGRRDPVPVRIEDVSDRAIEKQRRIGPDTVIVQLLDAQGRPIREIAADLADLERRDGTNRYSGTVQGTVTSFIEVG